MDTDRPSILLDSSSNFQFGLNLELVSLYRDMTVLEDEPPMSPAAIRCISCQSFSYKNSRERC